MGKYVSYAWEGPPYGNPPPRAEKWRRRGPSQSLLRLAKVTQKRGFCRQFSSGFAAGFPAVRRRFSGGSTPVFQRFSSGFPAASRQLPGSFPAVCRWFDRGFAGGSTAVSWWFPGGFRAVWPAVLPTVRRRRGLPGSTPVRLRRTPSSERNCRAIPYTLSSLQTQHSARQAPGWFGRAVAGKVGRR